MSRRTARGVRWKCPAGAQSVVGAKSQGEQLEIGGKGEDAVTGGRRMRAYSRAKQSWGGRSGNRVIMAAWSAGLVTVEVVFCIVPCPRWLDARASPWRCWVVRLISRYTMLSTALR